MDKKCHSITIHFQMRKGFNPYGLNSAHLYWHDLLKNTDIKIKTDQSWFGVICQLKIDLVIFSKMINLKIIPLFQK